MSKLVRISDKAYEKIMSLCHEEHTTVGRVIDDALAEGGGPIARLNAIQKSINEIKERMY